MFLMFRVAEQVALARSKPQERRDVVMLPQEPRLKIKTYTPLTFVCAQCGAVFDASNRPGEQLTAEVEQHMNEEHFVQQAA